MARIGLGGSSPTAWLVALALVALALMTLAFVIMRRAPATPEAPLEAPALAQSPPVTASVAVHPEPPPSTTPPIARVAPPSTLPVAIDPPPVTSERPLTTLGARPSRPRGGEPSMRSRTSEPSMSPAPPSSEEPVVMPGILNPFE